ncbi:MAG: DUF4148 domain-containing protein [Polaromonas sp.]
MKSNFFATGLLLTVALSAATSFAAEGVRHSGWASPGTSSTLTREAVRAEYIAARTNDTLPPNGERDYGVTAPNTVSTLTREAVRAEYFAAKKNGTLLFIGERN